MKTKKGLSIFYWLFAFLLLSACSKTDNLNPNLANKPHLKDCPQLVNDTGYYSLDQKPSFPGGDSVFRAYIKSNLTYPKKAIQNNITGEVYTSFIVETDGSISNVTTLKGIGYGCDDAVISVLENMPSWSPGIKNKQHVRVQLVFPMNFTIPQ